MLGIRRGVSIKPFLARPKRSAIVIVVASLGYKDEADRRRPPLCRRTAAYLPQLADFLIGNGVAAAVDAGVEVHAALESCHSAQCHHPS